MKKIFSFLLAAVLLLSLSAAAFADTSWLVRFTTDEKMVSNFAQKQDEFNDTIRGMQPGDSISFTVTLRNEHSGLTDWYMTNEVINSLETKSNNSATHGGAYTYLLTYTGPTGTVLTLHDSSTVGGSSNNIIAAREGLKSATTALKDYFYLDTLGQGQTGTIRLTIELDGETQGNDYQDTAADLKMNFAVELKGSSSRTNVVKTGDDTNLLPAYIVMAVSGLLFLYLAVDSVKQRRKEARG